MPPNTADVRQFLTDYFSDEELTTLCFDFFPEVHNSFASGMSKGQKVQLLLEYVQRRGQQSRLLGVLQQQRPDQYARRFPSYSDPPGAEPLHPASPFNDSRVPNPKPAADSSRALRIFLCHSSVDKPAVRELYQRLRADGFEPWLDEEDLLPGQDWQREIPKAVRDADVVVVCLSRGSINKVGYVQKEIKFALDAADEQPENTIYVIPLKLEKCDVPERLNRWQWVNLFSPNGYERLMRALQVRATSLGLGVSLTQPPATPVPQSQTGATPARPVSNVSGGVNIDGQPVTIGNDVVGRDKIIQATTYIEHATIIQAPPIAARGVAPADEAGPAANARTWGGIEFVRIPAGKFLMGSQDDNKWAANDEKPQFTFDIPYDYWIARYPVTNEQFAQFVEATDYRFSPEKNWQKNGDRPVVNVTWHAATQYCRWLNTLVASHIQIVKARARLPTEAEWEKAARGKEGNEWPWGNVFDPDKCNSRVSSHGGTTPVGMYSPYGDSPYGVADLAGNVWEWCHSLYQPYPYELDPSREDETSSGTRVLRGGSFAYDRGSTRCAFRLNDFPDTRLGHTGFRVAVAPDP
jgi:formylglycine-generating enzyme required for sulfatase activity